MDAILNFFSIDMLHSGIRLTTPIVFAAVAAALSFRAGVFNLAIESKMLVGAFVGIWTLNLVGNPVVAVLAAAASGAIIGLLMAWANRLGVDLVVFAIGLNLLALQLTVYLMREFLGGVGVWKPDVKPLPVIHIPIVENIPIIGETISGYNLLVYLAFAAAILYGVLFKTRVGRHLIAVGEMPKAAAGVGISVVKIQTGALVVSGALAGIGGSFLSVGDLGLFTQNMSNGKGWIAVTAALLAMNLPRYIVPSALLFGFSDAVAIRLQTTTDLPQVVIQLIPFVATLIVLAIVGRRMLQRAKRFGLPKRRRASRSMLADRPADT